VRNEFPQNPLFIDIYDLKMLFRSLLYEPEPPCNTTHRLNSFFVQSAGKWNDVPPVLKRRLNLVAYKESYLLHFGWAADGDG
jgi:hypothetical protein